MFEPAYSFDFGVDCWEFLSGVAEVRGFAEYASDHIGHRIDVSTAEFGYRWIDARALADGV